jgi:gamma-glutamyltranspeptidase/glutathione hydrolase
MMSAYRLMLTMLLLKSACVESRPVVAVDSPAAIAQAETGLYQNGVVAADHPLASEAGAEMLRRGGNVVDAAVATAFALGVLRPEGCGIGGGGFMVIWNAERQEAVAIDYRERAPRAATRDMYEKTAKEGIVPPASEVGGLAVAVPGDVAGLCYAVEHYGTLDLKTVLAPAIRLAREGVTVDDSMRSSQKSVLADFAKRPEHRKRYAALWSHYLNEGEPWREGARFDSPLEDVLTRIAEQGPSGFYEGVVGESIAAAVQKAGGVITVQDLAEVKPVVVRAPVRTKLGDLEFLSMPPPSSGGIALIEALQILDAWEQGRPDQTLHDLGHNSAEYVHLVTEALKHAFADRAEFLGDADFVKVPVEKLTSDAYAEALAAKIRMDRTLPLEAYGSRLPTDDAGTSHLCVIDAQGNAVACTETINTYFGSHVVEPRFGIVLNNEMDDFAALPGIPNAFGLIQSENNAVAPGKKPLSSMTPTIAVREGKAVYVAGASGGPRIISATLQALLNMHRFGMTPQQAVAAPRFHHQWLPETLYLEAPLRETLAVPLSRRGHELTAPSHVGTAQAVMRTPRGLLGGSDPRKGGRPAGW